MSSHDSPPMLPLNWEKSPDQSQFSTSSMRNYIQNIILIYSFYQSKSIGYPALIVHICLNYYTMISAQHHSALVLFKEGHHQDHANDPQQWFKSLFDDEQWDISAGRFEYVEQTELLKSITQLNISSLKLRWNEQAKIVKMIEMISFPNLKELFLNGNKIESIEGLANMQIQNLNTLNLKQNYLITLKPLRKCKFQDIRDISVYQNLLQDTRSLAELGAKSLKVVWLNTELQLLFGEYFSWMFKLESENMKTFYVSSKERVQKSTDRILDKMKDKYPNIRQKYQLREFHWI